MQIQEAILHRISKERNSSGSNAVSIHARTSTLPLDDKLTRTVEEILKIYSKSTSGYGTFDANQTVYRFPVHLQDYAVSKADFIAFTRHTIELIAYKMRDEHLATGGYALILRYTNLGQDWLLVAMLKLKPGTGVNESTLELSDTLTFDIDHLHEAARIDLGKWQSNTQPYLSFVKKRQSDGLVSKYFREALACTEYTDSKYQTTQMREAFEDYAQTNNWSLEEKRAGRQRIFDYCEAKDKAGDPVNLAALSAIINDQNPTSFNDFVKESEYEISDTFKPHKTTYGRFKRISRAFGSIRVSFDVQDILDGKVDFDDTGECLVINNLPTELIEEVKRHKGNTDDTDGSA
jgi:nucleoid-associated protein